MVRRHSPLRAAVVAVAAGVVLASLPAFRLEDWLLYAVFLAISAVLYVPSVEVMPRMTIGIPHLASTIGFVYIGGWPVIVLAVLAPGLMRLLREVLPERWQERTPQLAGLMARRRILVAGAEFTSQLLAEQATFVLGLAVRLSVASALAAPYPPTAVPWAIAVGEVSGYLCWGVLSILPIYPDGTLLPLSGAGRFRTVLADISLIVAFWVTPFVFLVAYGFRRDGLEGAAAWSLATLGLHFTLKRLNERRLQLDEQKRRLEALNRELEHRERLSAIGKMSSVVSHQILQQLGVIGIHADLIRNADGSSDPVAALARARENAVAIEEAVRDVNRVLRDLLVFSKDLRLNLYEHELDRIVGECAEECRAEAEARGVRLVAECPPGIVAVLDKLKIKQALANVIRNAIEASPAGGVVRIAATRESGWVEIAVTDQGPGIAPEHRQALFTPFFTTKEHGTGLGLAIAREFAVAHGGQLEARDGAEQTGATFVFRLPVRPPG